MTSSRILAVYDGSGIDGSLYTQVNKWAEAAPHWLDEVIKVWSAIGLGLFALFMLWAWWRARGADSTVMARVLASPVIVVVAYAANSVLKGIVEELRPCAQIPGSVSLETCPATGDWSFPSNHSVIAFAAAASLWFVNRRLGWIAGLFAVLMAASRVWVGVHYPHDVAAGALVGVLVAVVLAPLAGRCGPLVGRMRSGPLRPLLGPGELPAVAPGYAPYGAGRH
ncbi:undecaprenyl-diphosphatase [Streptomyces sp. 1114.5]|uniref:phosphatase PAP2 family protein n=1 Tax=unclassified Streptomyces TaxID=2593676 RepID=UPI000BC4A3B5|nr:MULTISPECIES: phosphatase PAP2 family protein [unclassified Streptomyces]RKT11126.1 undecaprenyl-diphosphatase [Streptomyces sp. 1114.5]SOB81542.1 undecaprenyl-diphosphatase [Streptomyces sp. 1331.2]